MKKVFIIAIIYLLCVSHASAEVSQFVFTNESRTVAPGVLSESLTIQSQNSSGTQEAVVETTDLVFQSSSPTGEFLNSAGNPVSTTMSKNTANRTFYYRDSNTGSHTLTVTATGRETQKSFKATQSIVVGLLSTTTDQVSTSTATSTSTSTGTSSSNSTSISSHSSPSPIYSSNDIVSFEVSAGRKRFASVGSDMVFKAEPVKLLGVPETYIQYHWTFGDGTIAQGQLVSHRYKFPGEYVVVLNATYGDKSAVSRTNVEIIEPIFVIEPVRGGIKVINKSQGEVNVGEWVIEGAHTRFEVPRDTIIQKGKSVIFSYDAVINNTDVVIFKNPLGSVVAEYRPVEIVKSESIVVEPVVTQEQPKTKKIISVKKAVPRKKVAVVPRVEKALGSSTKEVSRDMVATVYVGAPKNSAVESLLWIPKKGWGMLAGFFR